MNLEANRSIWDQCHQLHMDWRTSVMRDYFVWMVWPSLDSLSGTTFSQPGMCRALRVTCFQEHQVRIFHRSPTSCLLPCLCKPLLWCCLLQQELSCLSRGLGTLLGPRRQLLVPDSLYAACFLEETRFLLQCVPLSEHSTLLLMQL